MSKKIVFILFIILTITVGCSKNKTIEYTVTFDTDGGSKIEKIIVKEGEKISFPDNPEKEGYIFNGWYLDNKLFNSNEKIYKDIELRANWIETNKKMYRVIFVYNNDSKNDEVLVEENKKVDEPLTPIKKGYIFNGWYLDGEMYDFSKTVTKDITLMANWKQETSSEKVDTSKESVNATKKYECYDSSYKLNGTKCVKSINIDSTKEYYCESGYVLNGTTCSKSVSKTDRQKASVSYSCISPYVLNGNKCSYYLSSDALTRFYCSNGTLSGASCITKVKYPLVRSVSQWCANNGLSGSGVCPRSGCSAVGGIYDDNEYKNNSSSLYWCYKWNESTTSAKSEYYCPSGYVLNGTKCEKYYEVDAVPSYSCPSGYSPSGSDCIKTTYSTDKVSAKYKYICPSGYTLSNDTCKKEFSVDANKVYTCPKGYSLYKDRCYKN